MYTEMIYFASWVEFYLVSWKRSEKEDNDKYELLIKLIKFLN